MSRGLSNLQQFIVARAAATPDLLYIGEILADFFGWEPVRPIRDDSGKRVRFYCFSAKLIGMKRYGKTMATVSRACRRLEELGLVQRRQGWAGSGVEITPRGRECLLMKRNP